MPAKLRCRISAGQFSSECVVVVHSHIGRQFSLFAPRSAVTMLQPPTEGQSVEGWINVDVVERQGQLILVKLPTTTLENGPYLTVNLGQLDLPKDAPSAAPAGS